MQCQGDTFSLLYLIHKSYGENTLQGELLIIYLVPILFYFHPLNYRLVIGLVLLFLLWSCVYKNYFKLFTNKIEGKSFLLLIRNLNFHDRVAVHVYCNIVFNGSSFIR